MTKIVDLDTHAEPYVTIQQLADYWQVSYRTIQRHIEKGALAVVRLGPFEKLVRIPIDEARRYGRPNGA